jgi:arylsulfatase A-like enzyme
MKDYPRGMRYVLAFGLAFAALLIVAELIIPRVIASAYREESLGFLNRVFSGRDQHTLDHYLTAWHSRSRAAILYLAVTVGVVAVWRWKIAALVRPVLSVGPELSVGWTLWIAAWFGAVAGIGEALLPLSRYLIRHHPGGRFRWEAMWMGPLAAILAFALVGLLIVVVARVSSQERGWLVPVTMRNAVSVLSGLAAWEILRRPETQLASYAAVILSLGVAASFARLSRRHPDRVLRFVRRTSVPITVLLLFTTAAGILTLPGPLERRRIAALPASQGGPNVLLIILDTVRASSLSLYGYERRTTPNLDRFAAEGVVFDRAIATAPWTLPSHASMFTGLYANRMTADIGVPLDRTDPVLAEVLAARGYATTAFVANYFYTTESSGLARGFARYEDYPINAGSFFRSAWLASRIFTRIARLPDPGGRKPAATVTDELLRWLSNRPDRPFFAFLNYIDAHDPYTVPPTWETKFNGPGQPAMPVITAKREGIEPEELEGTRLAYDNAIAYADSEVGRLLDELRQRGILENTIVVITSDHGEHLGEHGLQRHTNSLYMPLLHVPLIVVYPARVPRTTRIDPPVTIRDIPSTILDLAGVHSVGVLGGSALSRHWEATGPVALADEPILAELNYWGVIQRLIMPWDPVYQGAMKSLVLGDLHYIRNGLGEEQVFDLSIDPAELTDLSDTLDPRLLLDFRTALDSLTGGM